MSAEPSRVCVICHDTVPIDDVAVPFRARPGHGICLACLDRAAGRSPRLSPALRREVEHAARANG